MQFVVRSEWTTHGLTARAVECGERGAQDGVHHWWNGYVGVPKGHPLYQVDYHEATFALPPAEEIPERANPVKALLAFAAAHEGKERRAPEDHFDVHGSLTFAGTLEGSDLWWFGFDTNHYNDGPHTKNEVFVRAECESLAEQLATFEYLT